VCLGSQREAGCTWVAEESNRFPVRMIAWSISAPLRRGGTGSAFVTPGVEVVNDHPGVAKGGDQGGGVPAPGV
jgi:hypothetical protein